MLLAGCSASLACAASPPAATAGRAEQLVLAHYMPWYASKPVSGEWGWHWTMNRFNLDTLKPDGRRELASHDEPLIGPYDSGDDDALECHALLMKFAGLDGVVVDWYGISDVRDYGMIHRNTRRLIPHLKRAGLRFAVCYEDQSVKHRVDSGHVAADRAVEAASADLRWAADNWFGDAAYVTLDGRPVLLIFGPQQISDAQWRSIVPSLPKPPLLFGLPHLYREAGLDGAFGWPPVSGNREIPRDEWRAYFARLHACARPISVVFPGFRDIYAEAGLHESYGFIDDGGGQTFAETLTLARNGPSPMIQVATWNDHGEGTAIEPTRNHGFRHLEALQRLPGRSAFRADDLRLPVRLYLVRKSHAGRPLKATELRTISDLLFAGRCAEAGVMLDAMDGRAPRAGSGP